MEQKKDERDEYEMILYFNQLLYMYRMFINHMQNKYSLMNKGLRIILNR